MGAAEEVIAGPNFPEGVERERFGIHREPAEQGVDGAQMVRVQHELLVAGGERGLQPAGRVQDEVGAAQQRGVERRDALLIATRSGGVGSCPIRLAAWTGLRLNRCRPHGSDVGQFLNPRIGRLSPRARTATNHAHGQFIHRVIIACSRRRRWVVASASLPATGRAHRFTLRTGPVPRGRLAGSDPSGPLSPTARRGDPS